MTNNTIDINEITLKNYIEKMRPEKPEIREKIDFGYSFDGRVALLFEIRPDWKNPEVKNEYPFAKIKYIKSKQEWNLYWLRASGKWEAYEPFPKAKQLDKIIVAIDEDEYACFFG